MASLSRFVSIFMVLQTNIGIFKGEWNTNDFQKRENSLSKPYEAALWDPVGHTMITPNFVRLTSDRQSQKGGVWNNVPVNAINWEMHVHFKVHGQGGALFGDGFAAWYVRDRAQIGPVFGSSDFFHGLAVFFDTYSNHNGPHEHGHPYISAMVNNGSLNYDHDRDGTHTELAGCESQFRTNEHDTYIAIRYSQSTLTILTDIESKNSWKECFSVQGVYLPTGYFLGFSAATGQLADNHDIISVKLYELDVEGGDANVDVDHSKIVPHSDLFTPPRDHVGDPKGAFMSDMLSGWRLLIIIILVIIGLGVCLVVGMVVFQKNQQTSKRFY